MIHKSGLLEVFGNLLAAVEAVHAVIFGYVAFDLRLDGIEVDMCVGREDVISLEIVLLTQGIVIHVVGRRNLEAACTESDFDIAVLDDGNLTAYERNAHMFAAKPLVLLLFGVDADRDIAEDGFGTRCCDNGITSGFLYHLIF